MGGAVLRWWVAVVLLAGCVAAAAGQPEVDGVAVVAPRSSGSAHVATSTTVASTPATSPPTTAVAPTAATPAPASVPTTTAVPPTTAATRSTLPAPSPITSPTAPPDPAPVAATGLRARARFTDGATKDVCVNLSDWAGTTASARIRPGAWVDIPFPPRPEVRVWVGACDEAVHDEHAPLEARYAVPADGMTVADWVLPRNELVVELLALRPDGSPLPGLCVEVGDEHLHTGPDGRARSVVELAREAAGMVWGSGCPDGGNWILRTNDEVLWLDAAPGSTVRLSRVVDVPPPG